MELLWVIGISFGAVIAAWAVGEGLERRRGWREQSRLYRETTALAEGLAKTLAEAALLERGETAAAARLLANYMLQQRGLSPLQGLAPEEERAG